MRKTFLMGATSAMALLIAACGTNEEAAPNEMAAANDMNTMMADPNNPFAQAEAQMHEQMMAAAGADPSETWIRKMIEHHRGAVAMSDVVLAQNPTPEVRAEAEKTRTNQLKEISRLEAMLRPEQADAATAQPTAPAAQTSRRPQHRSARLLRRDQRPSRRRSPKNRPTPTRGTT